MARIQPDMQTVVHPLKPLVAPGAHTLILGTMPSPQSRAQGMYYAHPRNRFWPVLARVLGCDDPRSTEGRALLVLDHGLALWDVLQRCDIHGAADASIRHPVPNDLPGLIQRTNIDRIYTTGRTAYNLYQRLCEPATGIAAVCLPSTSPANARWTFEQLVAAYAPLLHH